MEPKNGRLVRVQGGRELLFIDLESTGKYEDVLLSAERQAARRVQIVSDDGQPIPVLRFPAIRVSSSAPAVSRITLAELTHPLTPGEGVIVSSSSRSRAASGSSASSSRRQFRAHSAPSRGHPRTPLLS